eukprot:97242_1
MYPILLKFSLFTFKFCRSQSNSHSTCYIMTTTPYNAPYPSTTASSVQPQPKNLTFQSIIHNHQLLLVKYLHLQFIQLLIQQVILHLKPTNIPIYPCTQTQSDQICEMYQSINGPNEAHTAHPTPYQSLPALNPSSTSSNPLL